MITARQQYLIKHEILMSHHTINFSKVHRVIYTNAVVESALAGFIAGALLLTVCRLHFVSEAMKLLEDKCRWY